jgi:GNAT superfamily N-acetyltransferase
MAGLTLDEAAAFWRGQLPGMAEGARTLFVAEEGGRLIGTVVLSFAPQPNAPHRAEIGKMLVHSTARRRGLGRRLLGTAEQAAQAAGRTLLHLDTQTDSAGEKLYRDCGWVFMGAMPGHSHCPDGRLAAASFFYKHLAPAG